jgi:hypothetical protein
METGAVGAMGGAASMGGAAMAAPAGAAVAGGSAPASASAGNGMSIDGMTPQMQALVDLMGSMSSAQILMALMMSGGKKKGDDSDPFAALMGMAMASQMTQMAAGLSQMLNAGNMTSSCCGSTVGTQLNVMA